MIPRAICFPKAIGYLGVVISTLFLVAPTTPSVLAQQEVTQMNQHAKGTFEVKMTPQAPDPADPTIGRFVFDKQFSGDLQGTSRGQMLGAGDPAEGNAGYVAIEHITGTLRGRTGSFVLQHSGTMSGGALQLSVSVIPGSGTGELKGISGTMDIKIEGDKHFYTFDYTLPSNQ